jgi:hypothetical protein
MRVRVVNQCVAADEGPPDKLMATLDQDVTVIDPREAEAAIRREFQRCEHIRMRNVPRWSSLRGGRGARKTSPWSRTFLGPRGRDPGFREPGDHAAAPLRSGVRALAWQHAPDPRRDHQAHRRRTRAGSRSARARNMTATDAPVEARPRPMIFLLGPRDRALQPPARREIVKRRG